MPKIQIGPATCDVIAPGRHPDGGEEGHLIRFPAGTYAFLEGELGPSGLVRGISQLVARQWDEHTNGG